MYSNSSPLPVLAWIVLRRNASSMPTSHAAPDTSMNSWVLVRAAGTPTWRAASLLPPTANVQLPNWVRVSIQVPMPRPL